MRAINKSSGPAFLASYKKNHPGDWGALDAADKQAIRKQLVQEQLGLCAYCMRRISENPTPTDRTKIEHIVPQSNEATVFDWANLIACCNGNQGCPPAAQTCDTKKGEQRLAQLNVLAAHSITFGRTSGLISSDLPAVDDDLTKILNLNEDVLVADRKKAIDGLNQALQRGLKKSGVWRREPLQRFLVSQRAERTAAPYLGLIEDIIGRLIQRAS